MDEMIQPEIKENISKITSSLLWLNFETILKMNVVMVKYRNNKELHYYKEVSYPRGNSSDRNLNVSLDYDYYLSIESVNRLGLKRKKNIYVQIRIQDILLFRDIVMDVYKSVREHFEDIYQINSDGIITGMKRNNDVLGGMYNLAMGNSIIFKPDITERSNDSLMEAIRFMFPKEKEYTVVDMNKFCAFVEIIDKLNLPMYAQELVNYVGKPELGTNRYEMKSDMDEMKTSGGNNPRADLKIKKQEYSKKSYFTSSHVNDDE